MYSLQISSLLHSNLLFLSQKSPGPKSQPKSNIQQEPATIALTLDCISTQRPLRRMITHLPIYIETLEQFERPSCKQTSERSCADDDGPDDESSGESGEGLDDK